MHLFGSEDRYRLCNGYTLTRKQEGSSSLPNCHAKYHGSNHLTTNAEIEKTDGGKTFCVCLLFAPVAKIPSDISMIVTGHDLQFSPC